MTTGDNLFVAARKAAGQTQKQAAQTCHIGVTSFVSREKDPLDFRLGELLDLFKSYGAGARMVLKSAIDDVFLQEGVN